MVFDKKQSAVSTQQSAEPAALQPKAFDVWDIPVENWDIPPEKLGYPSGKLGYPSGMFRLKSFFVGMMSSR
jgi:hypothetical protein